MLCVLTVNSPVLGSNPTCTVCSKSIGDDISGLSFPGEGGGEKGGRKGEMEIEEGRERGGGGRETSIEWLHRIHT